MEIVLFAIVKVEKKSMSSVSPNQAHMHSLFENEEDTLFNLFAKGGDHLHYLFENKKGVDIFKE